MDNAMRGVMFSGLVYSPGRPGGSMRQHGDSPFEDTQSDEQFDALMSLALDDMLSPDEAERFDRMLAAQPGLGDAWESWQALDRAFQNAPRVVPPADFVTAFESRLLRSERRWRLWLGLAVGMVAAALWGSLILGLAGAGAYVMFNQSEWLAEAVRFLVYWSASIQSQIAMIAAAFETAAATPQTQGVAFVYTVFASITLWFWARFLRRSVENRGSVASTAS